MHTTKTGFVSREYTCICIIHVYDFPSFLAILVHIYVYMYVTRMMRLFIVVVRYSFTHTYISYHRLDMITATHTYPYTTHTTSPV
jgi:hypothetical protein